MKRRKHEEHSGVRYPDFYNDEMVLDAKYKRLGSYNKVSKVDPDDVHQLIAYLTALHIKKGGFIAPLEQKQVKIPTSHLQGNSAVLSIYGIEISKTTSSYADFCNKMEGKEKVFIKSLNI